MTYLHNQVPPIQEAFLRLPQVLARFPVSRSHWWDGVRLGKYPKAYHLSAKVTAWKTSDIDFLIQSYEQKESNR